MNNEFMVTLESRTNIQDFKEISSGLASLLRNYFKYVNSGAVWVSGASSNDVVSILETGTIIFNCYDIDFTNEDLLNSIFTRINRIRDAVIAISNIKFDNMCLRLNFEHPNTISEITQKLLILEKVLAKAEIGIDSMSMEHAERIGGPYKVLEVVVSC